MKKVISSIRDNSPDDHSVDSAAVHLNLRTGIYGYSTGSCTCNDNSPHTKSYGSSTDNSTSSGCAGNGSDDRNTGSSTSD